MMSEEDMVASEVKDLIRAVSRRWLTLEKIGPKVPGEYGDTVYSVETGHKIVIFWDAGDYDYIDSVILPDGTEVDFINDIARSMDSDQDKQVLENFSDLVVSIG